MYCGRNAGVLILLMCALVGVHGYHATYVRAEFEDEPRETPQNFGVDGLISSMALDDTTLYLGGDFQCAGTVTGGGIAVYEKSTGDHDGTVWPASVNTTDDWNIRTAVSDGAGGWYIGGEFDFVGGVERNGLVHILDDGSVDPDFDPNVDGEVRALVLDGSTLYVGGDFTTVNGGTTRNNLAAVDSTTGIATSFDPNIDWLSNPPQVNDLELGSGTLYVAGQFDTVNGGTTRNNIAAFDTTTGIATSFDPDANSPVLVLLLDGTTLYTGGSFFTIGGQSRNRLAALSTTTGLAGAFNPDLNSEPYTLFLDGGTLYAGGDFTTVNQGTTPETRNHLAAFSTTTGTATSFDPDIGDRVYALYLDGTTLYAGGEFETVNGGTDRNKIAALDTTTGTATSFNPSPGGAVNVLIDQGTNIAAAGEFRIANCVARNYFAAFDLSTGDLLPFDPDLDSEVFVVELSGTTLYVGGSFTTVNGGTPRNRLAAFDTGTGTATAFDPDIDSEVQAMLLDGTTLFVAGAFTTVNGATPRNYLAAFDTTTGTATSFDPDLDTNASALVLDGTTIYVGGSFTTVNGATPRNYLAAFDTTTGTATSFDPDVDGNVSSLLLDGATLYAGGSFTSVNGGTPRNYFAAFDTTTGTATSFDPDMDSGPRVLFIDGTTIYAGGDFTTVNGATTRNNLAAFDSTTGVVTSFNPDIDGDVRAFAGGSLLVGGSFKSAQEYSIALGGLAILEDIVTATPTPSDSPPSGGSLLTPEQLIALFGTPTPAPMPSAPLFDEGTSITAYQAAGDPDVYVTNGRGFKRLILSPAILNFYGHLRNLPGLQQVAVPTRDSALTSGLYRNCEINDPRIYALEVAAEDTGILHLITFAPPDPVSVFCVNTRELTWYPKGAPYTSLTQLPSYRR